VGVAVADLATGQNAAIAILAALLQRQSSGLGQHIDLSLFDTQLSLLANVGSSALFTGADAVRQGNAHANIVPYEAFRASDGQFVLTVASEKLWALACEALGRHEWLQDPRYASNAARVRHRHVLGAELQAMFLRETCGHWLALFAAAGVPAAAINSVRQALDHPIAHARGMRLQIDGVPMVGSPLKLSASPPICERAPPALGQHSDEIAAALGFDPGALRAQGAIR
jgi:crotonobetainyl-CoA:carnitine CoA-transferase CaiB-like acyl-CoA transferase